MDPVKSLSNTSPHDQMVIPNPQKERSNSRVKGSFSIPPGTEWCDIKIKFKDVTSINITIGSQRPIERNFKSLKCFYNQKTKNFRNAWKHLLTLAAHQGYPPPTLKEEVTPAHVYALNKNLKEIFPTIVGNPFAGYKKNIGWKPRVNLSISKHLYKQSQDPNQ